MQSFSWAQLNYPYAYNKYGFRDIWSSNIYKWYHIRHLPKFEWQDVNGTGSGGGIYSSIFLYLGHKKKRFKSVSVLIFQHCTFYTLWFYTFWGLHVIFRGIYSFIYLFIDLLFFEWLKIWRHQYQKIIFLSTAGAKIIQES